MIHAAETARPAAWGQRVTVDPCRRCTTDRLSDAVVELVGKHCPGAAEESGQ